MQREDDDGDKRRCVDRDRGALMSSPPSTIARAFLSAGAACRLGSRWVTAIRQAVAQLSNTLLEPARSQTELTQSDDW